MLGFLLKRLRYKYHLSVLADIIDDKNKNRGNKERETFSNEKVGGDRNLEVKRKGTRFWEKKNEIKILYLARLM